MTINAPEYVRLHGNPIKFHQLFANLISNAIDAYEGMDPEQSHAIHITMKEGGDILSVTVQDWGVGIPNENRSRIFEPFFTTKEVGKGTGLGLSVSYGIVQEHGGNISAESSVGRGTSFRLDFPLSRKAVNV